MLHVISARCVARDLHTNAPGPLARTCLRRFAAQWRDCKKISNCAFECDYYHYYYYLNNWHFSGYPVRCLALSQCKDSSAKCPYASFDEVEGLVCDFCLSMAVHKIEVHLIVGTQKRLDKIVVMRAYSVSVSHCLCLSFTRYLCLSVSLSPHPLHLSQSPPPPPPPTTSYFVVAFVVVVVVVSTDLFQWGQHGIIRGKPPIQSVRVTIISGFIDTCMVPRCNSYVTNSGFNDLAGMLCS